MLDGDALIAEYDTSNRMLRRYIHGDQVDEPWVQYNTSAIGDAHRKFLHADHQGSIIAITNTHGAAVNTFEYDVYGIPAAKNIERFGYTGQLYFKGLGLYYYKARFYHPKLGRFLQTDPVGYEDQMNLYAYVGNDPLNMVDPTGEFGVFGALISAGIEIAVQSVQVAKGGSYDVGKIAISALAGGAGVGLGQKAAQLGSLLSNGSKVAATTSKVAGAVTEAVATNVIETSANNIVNSITGDKPMENINAQGAATNAVANTAVGNVADNKIGASGTKKADLVKGAAEGLRKAYEKYKKD